MDPDLPISQQSTWSSALNKNLRPIFMTSRSITLLAQMGVKHRFRDIARVFARAEVRGGYLFDLGDAGRHEPGVRRGSCRFWHSIEQHG